MAIARFDLRRLGLIPRSGTRKMRPSLREEEWAAQRSNAALGSVELYGEHSHESRFDHSCSVRLNYGFVRSGFGGRRILRFQERRTSRHVGGDIKRWRKFSRRVSIARYSQDRARNRPGGGSEARSSGTTGASCTANLGRWQYGLPTIKEGFAPSFFCLPKGTESVTRPRGHFAASRDGRLQFSG